MTNKEHTSHGSSTGETHVPEAKTETQVLNGLSDSALPSANPNEVDPSPAPEKHETEAAVKAVEEVDQSKSSSASGKLNRHASWDELGQKLVDARKELDAATEADKVAGAELLAAQQKKAVTLKNLQSKAQLVKQLAAEFTALAAGLASVTGTDEPSEQPSGPSAERTITGPRPAFRSLPGSVPWLSSTGAHQTPHLAKPFRPAPHTGNSVTPQESRFASSQGSSASSSGPLRRASASNDFEPLTSSSTKRAKVSSASETPTPPPGRESPGQTLTTASHDTAGDEAAGESDDVASDGGDMPKEQSSNFSRKKRKNNYAHSIFRGVRKILSTGQYECRITALGKDIFLGRYDTEEEAARKYDEKARALHRDRAILNFITDEDRAIGCRSALEVPIRKKIVTTRPPGSKA